VCGPNSAEFGYEVVWWELLEKSRVSESSISGEAAFFGDFTARNPASL
jgi:hypothetical protein